MKKMKLWVAMMVAAGIQYAGWGANITTTATGVWSEETTWDGGLPPGVEDEAWIRNNGHVTLDSAAGSIVSLRVAQLAGAVGSLTVSSDGSLTTTVGMVIGDRDNAHGTMTLDGGTVTSGGDVRIAGGVAYRENVTGILTINEGLFDASGQTLHAGFGSTGSSGTVNMTNGTLQVESLRLGNENAVGIVNLNGGKLIIHRPDAGGITGTAGKGKLNMSGDAVIEWRGDAHTFHMADLIIAGLVEFTGTSTNMLYETWNNEWDGPGGSMMYAYRDMEAPGTSTYFWVTGNQEPPPPPPEYVHVPYSEEEGKWLNVYIAEGTENGPPTPVYIWAHGGGGNADDLSGGLLDRLMAARISLISWASVEPVQTAADYLECVADAGKVIDFVLGHADVYNFNTNVIVIGGTSRGSGISWPVSHENTAVKGIYSTGALPYPFWSGGADPRDNVHTNSPPMFLAYPATPGDGNVHEPERGLLIQERYNELGIGDRATVEHSLAERGLNRWDYLADFIWEVAEGEEPPDVQYIHVPYSEEEGKWLNVYIAEGTENGPPTPVYIWAHSNGGSADSPGALLDRLSESGITLVSWASVDLIQTSAEWNEAVADAAKVLDFVFENASAYNIDTNRIVMGGSSRGSGISWELVQANSDRIRGIYNANAFANQMWSGGWDPRNYVHSDSPPLFLAYNATPGDGDGHDPNKGMWVKDAYQALGIGDRVTIEHSLEARGLNRWDFIADFIWDVTSTPVAIINPYAGIDWPSYGQYKGNLHTHTRLHKVLADGTVVFATGEIRAADGTVVQGPVDGYSHRSGERHPDYENAVGTIRGSDGHMTPADAINAYHSRGYSVLALTDHNSVTWPWTDYARDPAALNMVAIEGSEPSSHHHIGSFFNSHATAGSGGTIEQSLQTIGANGGLSVIFHPGRYTETVDWYVNLYETYDHLIGMEVYNQGDRYPQDRQVWDQVLTRLMPDRPVWGFSNDDMHRDTHLGRNWQTFILPELTEAAVRSAMENGRFYFSYAPGGHPAGGGDPAPLIQSITVDEAQGTISIEAAGHTNITWISKGAVVASNTLSIDVEGLQGYVRAVLMGPSGRTYTQPFALGEPDGGGQGPVDTDQDGIPDWWEEQFFGGPTNAVATNLAANGINTLLEAYLAGLDPTDPNSIFSVSGAVSPAGALLQWQVVSGRVYSVLWTPDLAKPFTVIDEIAFPQNSFSGAADTNRSGFYKLTAELHR